MSANIFKRLSIVVSSPRLASTYTSSAVNTLNRQLNMTTKADVTSFTQFFRDSQVETLKPIAGVVSGNIPTWIKGSLVQNGPGMQTIGMDRFNHAFDAMALLHRFNINNGKVTYQNKFLRSDTYLKNIAAKRIVVSELGTVAAPDPCQSIFSRVATRFYGGETSDNANISIYPIGDAFYAFPETPFMHRIDPSTLDHLKREDLKHLDIVHHTSHPQVLEDGSLVNIGLRVKGGRGPRYIIVKFTPAEKGSEPDLSKAEVVASVPCRWKFSPCYMHSFAVTDNYYVLIEQPLVMSAVQIWKSQLLNRPFAESIVHYDNEKVLIHLIKRHGGEDVATFTTDTAFFFHTANAYEQNNSVVLDVCCYDNGNLFGMAYYDAFKNALKDPNGPRNMGATMRRFVMSLNKREPRTIQAKVVTDVCCEMPRINQAHNGKKYTFAYCVSVGFNKLLKINVQTGQTWQWADDRVTVSEPVFLPKTDGPSQGEDDGVVVSSLLSRTDEKRVGLLFMNAKTWKEMGRVEFNTKTTVSKTLHGWFADGL